MNKQATGEEIQLALKHMKSCLTSYLINECKLKLPESSCLPLRLAKVETFQYTPVFGGAQGNAPSRNRSVPWHVACIKKKMAISINFCHFQYILPNYHRQSLAGVCADSCSGSCMPSIYFCQKFKESYNFRNGRDSFVYVFSNNFTTSQCRLFCVF